MHIILKILLSGFFILTFALIVNIIATQIGINTWYGFIEQISRLGFLSTIKSQGIKNLIFLFLIYPFILGSSGYLFFYLLK